MGQNIFRFTLSHSSGSQVINEPDGWAKIKISLERDKEYYSLVELIETPFIFYGSNGVYDGGMNFILEKKRVYGVNAQITIQVDISQDGDSYELLFFGLIDMQSLRTIDYRKLEAVITRSSKWATFFSRRDTPVDLNSTVDLDGNAVSNGNSMVQNLPSQKIRQSIEDNQVEKNDMGNDWTGTAPSASPNIDFNQNQYVTFELDTETLKEIDTKYHYGVTVRDDLPLPIYVLEYGGIYTIEISISITFKNLQTGGPVHYEYTSMSVLSPTFQHAFRLYLKINNDTPIEIPYTSHSQTVSAFTSTGLFTPTSPGLDGWDNFYYLDTLTLSANDEIRLYFQVENGAKFYEQYNGVSALLFQPVILGVDNSNIQWSGLVTDLPFQAIGSPASDPVIPSFIKITADTVYPQTEAEAFYLHDAAYEIIKRTVGDNSFYSEYTGSTQTLSLTYPDDGCGWNFVLLRGLQIRQYSLTEKPVSMSFKQWWDGVNPIHNLGLGYDTVDGNEVIRVEEKAFFFNDSPILYFNFVNNIEEAYDKESIFNKVKIGYKKWKSENISGIDDPQTNHDYSTLFNTVGMPITIQSDFIAASIAFEQARRTTRQKSADYVFDDDTFILAINRDINFPELDENFNSVTGLLNSDSRYNLALTPLRNLVRWFNVLSGCLQNYQTSVFKFNGGEGNYDMVSDYSGSAPGICFNKIAESLSEKQDLSMSYSGLLGYLFRPDTLEFKYPLSWANYKLIRDNRTRAIAVSESDTNHMICHIKKLEYDVMNSVGTFTVWKK